MPTLQKNFFLNLITNPQNLLLKSETLTAVHALAYVGSPSRRLL